MTADHFVEIVKKEKDSILALYFSENSETQVGKMIRDISDQGISTLFENIGKNKEDLKHKGMHNLSGLFLL